MLKVKTSYSYAVAVNWQMASYSFRFRLSHLEIRLKVQTHFSFLSPKCMHDKSKCCNKFDYLTTKYLHRYGCGYVYLIVWYGDMTIMETGAAKIHILINY